MAGHGRERDLKRDTPECAPKPIDLSRADGCDFIGQQDGSLCLLPFPDDYYTVRDPSHARPAAGSTLKTAAMPANASGTHIDAAPYNPSDGFSPGAGDRASRSPASTRQAALRRTGAVPINHIGRYREPERRSS